MRLFPVSNSSLNHIAKLKMLQRCTSPETIQSGQRQRQRCRLSAPEDLWRTGSSKASNGRLRDECLNIEWFTSLEEARRGLALWRDHYNHRRPHSALDDRSPAVFAALHGIHGKRFALFDSNKTNGKPRQGFASPADAALDPARRLSEDAGYQGEALSRIAQTRDSLLSIWSNFQARQTGSEDP